jgi:hypothetical protein
MKRKKNTNYHMSMKHKQKQIYCYDTNLKHSVDMCVFFIFFFFSSTMWSIYQKNVSLQYLITWSIVCFFLFFFAIEKKMWCCDHALQWVRQKNTIKRDVFVVVFMLLYTVSHPSIRWSLLSHQHQLKNFYWWLLNDIVIVI